MTELGRPGGETTDLRATIFEIRNARRSTAASDAGRVLKHQLNIYDHGGPICMIELGGPGGETAYLRATIFEMCDARRSTAASDAGRVLKHQLNIIDHGGPPYMTELGGPGGANSRFEGLSLRMRNARQSGTASDAARVHKHQMLMFGHDIQCTVRISDAPAVDIAYSRSHFTKRQCEAV